MYRRICASDLSKSVVIQLAFKFYTCWWKAVFLIKDNTQLQLHNVSYVSWSDPTFFVIAYSVIWYAPWNKVRLKRTLLRLFTTTNWLLLSLTKRPSETLIDLLPVRSTVALAMTYFCTRPSARHFISARSALCSYSALNFPYWELHSYAVQKTDYELISEQCLTNIVPVQF